MVLETGVQSLVESYQRLDVAFLYSQYYIHIYIYVCVCVCVCV